ncbi:MAG: DUF3833 domain-containing protein [Silicimonas sp.]|nr:DUF3833 domain-containing protein [Silicimonas sp.]
MDIFSFLIGAACVAGLGWLASRRFGFLAQTVDDYSGGPEFNVREVLNGALLCDGIIYGPTGRVASRFTARFDATWEGNDGVMREQFIYDSGSEQHREWRLSVDNTGRIRAEADDLVGSGTGRQAGSGVRLKYCIRLPEGGGGHVLDVVDWMYLLDNGTVMNRSQFRKFGIKVGELVATIRPDPSVAAQRKAA